MNSTTQHHLSRALLARLPPELCNEIYAHATNDNNPSTSFALPFKSKTFDFPRISKTIVSLKHHGNNGLLALHKYHFTEAREYYSWVMNHGVTLQITIKFTGNLLRFNMGDWTKKMSKHMEKLIKCYPFIPIIANWDVEILWHPEEKGFCEARNGVTASVVNSMLDCLFSFHDQKVGVRKGVLGVVLRINNTVAVSYMQYVKKFGLASFLRLSGLAAVERRMVVVAGKEVVRVVGRGGEGGLEVLIDEPETSANLWDEMVLALLTECK
ncbi:uncharacterized protein BDR25DRAFT_339590 [Lindgomyces ingoldianus]|uniref:Uncharacterized protein n=1 Tax=Lindgomyces ingoldianus TaxID=673940 RepID=A0ACB6RBT1_9PLEO|nr:uncharacterized protein BDR25DRAFT_339590 [Lindgomyces ingoldianus]KAF2476641.1 hypothetical protein BDR25DRAFT_339590 [Lindgomyces ingoldianus]